MKKRILKPLMVTLFIVITMTTITTGVYFYFNSQYGVPKSIAENAEAILYALRGNNQDAADLIQSYEEVCYNFIMTEPEEGQEPLFLLEVLSTAAGRDLLVNIPGNTRITMSNTLYVELSAGDPEIPQIIQLQNIPVHTGEEKWADYARKILEDFLGTAVSYYTVLPRTAFDDFFTVGNGRAELSESLKKLYQLPITQRKTMELMQKLYTLEGFSSNMDYTVRCRYLEFYESLQPDDFVFYEAEGKDMNEAFIMDAVKVKQAVYQHLNGE